MQEQRSNQTENQKDWDGGTYQTGSSRPTKGQSAIITVLLMSVIFLGGIASAFGVMNVRLVYQLMEQENNLSAHEDDAKEDTGAYVKFYHGDGVQSADLPQDDLLERRLGFRAAEINTLYRAYMEIPSGVQVEYVLESDCPLQEGDVLLYVDRQPLDALDDLYEAVSNADVGDTLSFDVLRVDQVLQVELTVE